MNIVQPAVLPLPPELVARFRAIVGDKYAVTDAADITPYVTEERDLFHGRSPLVLRPGTTAEVSEICKLASAHRIALVPQGGNTGLVGGQTPHHGEVVISLRRLDKIRDIDTASNTMTCEAGVVLQVAQQQAAKADRLFPLSLGAEGSCTIGGNLSTNAGGTAALAYGVAREMALGLEVVLADGRILNGLSKLKKDNTGYDLRNLFIGAEGTLGIITAACLKLFAQPRDVATALVGVPSAQAALDLLVRLKGSAGDALTTYELMPRRAVELTVELVEGVANPLQLGAAWYLLVEAGSPNPQQGLGELLTTQLAAAAADGVVVDALLANSLAQAKAMWKLRESIPEAQNRLGASLKHDVSVPVSQLPALIGRGTQLAEKLVPEGEVISYGHVGDGNLHFNVSQRRGADTTAFLARKAVLEEAVYDLVGELGGSFSAEHGIGRLRAAQMQRRSDATELAVMHALKAALDPKGILNPGKVLL